jgi:phosphate transport system substrate-binding protein
VKVVSIKKDKNSPAVSPLAADHQHLNFAAIHSTDYPIARYLYCYTAGKPAGALGGYMKWILGPEGQTVAEELGYVPLPKTAGATAETQP